MALARHVSSLPSGGGWASGEPLWKLVPKRDAAGRPYGDFMMLAPALKHRSPQELAATLQVIQTILARFGTGVAFADFNINLRVLWVSLECRPGLMAQVVTALRLQVPELKLVAHHPQAGSTTW